MKIPVRFRELSVHGMLCELFRGQTKITSKLDTLMSREAELEAIVAQNGAALARLETEVAELRTSGDNVIARLREQNAAQQATIDAQAARIAALQAGAVSPEALAALQATTDTAVAAANAAAADADASEAEWDAVAPPAEPPVA